MQVKQVGGGFTCPDKIFDSKIVNVLEQITKLIWPAAV